MFNTLFNIKRIQFNSEFLFNISPALECKFILLDEILRLWTSIHSLFLFDSILDKIMYLRLWISMVFLFCQKSNT